MPNEDKETFSEQADRLRRVALATFGGESCFLDQYDATFVYLHERRRLAMVAARHRDEDKAFVQACLDRVVVIDLAIQGLEGEYRQYLCRAVKAVFDAPERIPAKGIG